VPFMAAQREAVVAMLVVLANTTREAACMAAQEEATRATACVGEEAAAVAAQVEATCAAA
jgi:hypothetical protein